MNYFDFLPEDLPEIPKAERRHLDELVKFMKGVYGRVFTDPPVRSELPAEFLERCFRFRWNRQAGVHPKADLQPNVSLHRKGELPPEGPGDQAGKAG